VGRKDNRLSYTFRSIANYAIAIVVEVIRVNPETFKTTKLVGRITINGKEIEDLRGLKNQLDNIYQLQKKEREKLYKKI
jgi:hypothetical protein